MENVASFASLSRFSQPNDSDSSFRNAYEEYRNSEIPKPKRIESPLTKLDNRKLNLVPSRNLTQEISATSKAVHNQFKIDPIERSTSNVPGSTLDPVKGSMHQLHSQYSVQKRKRDQHPLLESVHNSLSFLITTDELNRQKEGIAISS